MSPWIDPLTISESPKSGHSSKQIQVQDVETGEMGSVNGAETSSHKQEVTFNAENHRFGNTVVSDHANAILGNVHYVYNFCCSPERIASYRRRLDHFALPYKPCLRSAVQSVASEILSKNSWATLSLVKHIPNSSPTV